VLAVDVTTAVIEVSGVPTLVVEGVIDLATVAELRDALTRLLREQFAQTRLDRALTIRSTVGRSTVDR
jgi:hypothetical protein